MEEILVQIACRLDNDLLRTVKNLLAKASRPDNVEILIINQDFEDNQWKQSDFPQNVTLINIEESKTRNLSQSRAFCHLYVKPSHKYFMNIDAHSRFDQNWDEILIKAHSEYTSLTGNKCMISVYPKGFKVSENGEDILIQDTSFAYNRLVKHGNTSFRVEAYPDSEKDITVPEQQYIPSIVAGGFHFTSIDWVLNVGYDIYCGWGEHELNVTLRTYCNGYDVVSYYIRPIYHLYDHTQRKSLKSPTFDYEINSVRRLHSQLLGSEITFAQDKFKLGDKRTIEDFEKFYNFELRKQLNLI